MPVITRVFSMKGDLKMIKDFRLGQWRFNAANLLVPILSTLIFLTSEPVFAGDMIVPDGNTSTRLDINGDVTDIHTDTVKNQNAFNSFSVFDVYEGKTVNLFLPDETQNLINMVHEGRTDINGILNSYKDGAIGGNVFFLNPHGLAIGSDGVVNTGSLTVMTPSLNFMNELFSDGLISESSVNSILSDNVPIGETGSVLINGKINTISGVKILSSNLLNQGEIKTNISLAPVSQQEYVSNIVNIDDSSDDLVIKDGRIVIDTAEDFVNSGLISADGSAGKDASSIEITAGNDIELKSGSKITASGIGENSSGGDIYLYAENNSIFNNNASIESKGGISGDGGNIEFSAAKEINILGGSIDAGAVNGRSGSIYIDPEILNVEVSFGSSGGDVNLEADNEINIYSGVTISTWGSSIFGAPNKAGKIDILAPNINIGDNVTLNAVSPDGNLKGDINILATLTDPDPLKVSSTSITIGNDVTLAGKDILVSSYSQDSAYSLITRRTSADINIGTGFTVDADNIGIRATSISTKKINDDTLKNIEDLPQVDTEKSSFLSGYSAFIGGSWTTADANINIDDNLNLNSENDISIKSYADSEASMMVLGTAIGAALVIVDSNAKVNIGENALISAENNIDINAKNNAVLNASSMLINLGDGKGAQIDAALTIADMDLDTTVTIEDSGNISAGDTVNIDASTDKFIQAASASLNFEDGIAGIAVTVSNSDVNNSVNIASDIEAQDINILSHIDEIDESGKEGNIARAVVGVGSGWLVHTFLKVEKAVTNKIREKLSLSTIDGRSGSTPLALSGAVVYSDHNNSATVDIGEDSSIKALGADPEKGKLNISSKIDTIIESSAIATIAADVYSDENKQDEFYRDNTVAAAVNISDYYNNVETRIGDNVSLDATGDINLFSEFNMPYEFTLIRPFSWDSSISKWDNIKNNISALLEDNVWLEYANGNLGIQKGGFNTWAQTQVATSSEEKTEGFGLAGSVNLVDYMQNSKVILGNDIRVNRNIEGRPGDLNITAASLAESVNFAGNIGLGWGVDAGKTGIGGSFVDVDSTSNVEAYIGERALINADNLGLKAENLNYQLSIATAGGSAGQYGVDGSVSFLSINNRTLAQIAQGAHIETGEDNDDPDDFSFIEAIDNSDALNITGAFSKAGNLSVGGSVSLTEMDRVTEAVLGNKETESTDERGYFSSGPSILIDAKNSGETYTIGVAGSVASGGSGPVGSTSAGGGAGSYGIGVSGEVGYFDSKETALAYINNYDVHSSQGDINLNALNDTYKFSVSGARTFADSAGLAGSVGLNYIDSDTKAFILNSDISAQDLISINAENKSKITAFASGGSGATKNDSILNLAGSVSINEISNNVYAYIEDSDLVSTNIELEALDGAEIFSIAGTAIFGGNAGIGAAFSKNEINNNTYSYMLNSSAESDKTYISAIESSGIFNISGSVGASESKGLALEASISLNDINSTTKAYFENDDLLLLKDFKASQSDGLDINAINDSEIMSIAGALSAGMSSVGVGVSTAKNKIQNSLDAHINGAHIDSNGGLRVVADQGGDIMTVAAGTVLASSGAVAGSIAVNDIYSDINAGISNSTGSVRSSAGILARNSSNIEFYGGSLTGSGSFGLGATFAVNTINSDIHSFINNSTLDIGGRYTHNWGDLIISDTDDEIYKGLYINSSADNNITVLNVNGGASTVSLQASVNITDVTSNVNSSIDDSDIRLNPDSSYVVTGNNFQVSSYNDTDVDVYGGALAISATRGAGTSQGYIDINNSTASKIANSDVYSINDVDINAESKERYDTVSISGAVSGTLSAAGVVDSVTIDSDTDAFIENSDVNSSGNINITAKDDAQMGADRGFILGGLSAGAAVGGVGGTLSFADINSDTKAYIKNSSTDAKTSTVISADSIQAINTVAATVSGGLYTGLAGTYTTRDITANTEAYIEETDGNNSVINADSGYTTVSQDVTITATSDTSIDTALSAGSLGAFGVGGSVDLSRINSTTAAAIKDGVEAHAGRDITVAANAEKSIESWGMGAAGGAGEFAGAVSVGTIGSNISNETEDNYLQNSRGEMSSQMSLNSQLNAANVGEESIALEDMERVSSRDYGSELTDVYSGEYNSTDRTAAYIGDNAAVTTGNDLSVTAYEDVKIDLVTGAASLSLGAIGSGISIADVNSSTDAFIGNNSSIIAGGNLTIDSDYHSSDYDVFGYAFNGSAAYLGVSVALAFSHNDVNAYIGDGTTIEAENDISITADTVSDMQVLSIGGSIAVGNIQAVVSEGYKSGVTQAYLGNNSNITKAHRLSILSNADSDISVKGQFGQLGALSLMTNRPYAEIDDDVLAYTGTDAEINVNYDTASSWGHTYNQKGNFKLSAMGSAATDMSTFAVEVSGAKLGGTNADSNIYVNTQSYIGENNDVKALNLSIESSQVDTTSNLDIYAAGGSGISLNAVTVDSTIKGNVKSMISDNSDITVDSYLKMTSGSETDQDVQSKAHSGSIIAAGGAWANAETDLDVDIELGDYLKLSTYNLGLTATASDKQFAKTISGTGGIVSGAGFSTKTGNYSDMNISIGKSSSDRTLTIGGTLKAEADYTSDLNHMVDSFNASVIGASGVNSDNINDVSVNVSLADQAQVRAKKIDVDINNRFKKEDLGEDVYNVYSGSGGAIDVAAATSKTDIRNSSAFTVGEGGILVSQNGDLDITVHNSVDADDKVKIVSGGEITVPVAVSEIKNNTNSADIAFGKDSIVKAKGLDSDINLEIVNTTDIESRVNASTYGLSGVVVGKARAFTSTQNKIDVGENALLYAQDSVNMMIGKTANYSDIDEEELGTRSDINVRSNVYMFNATELPFATSPEVKAEISQVNTFNIASGANVKGVGDINITSDPGIRKALGFSSAKNTYTAMLSLEDTSMDSQIADSSSVNIDGSLLAGSDNIQTITFNEGGGNSYASVTDKVGSISYSQKTENLQNSINDRIEELEGLIVEYSGLPEAVASYRSEIDRLKHELDLLGLIEDGNVVEAKDVDFIELDDIIANTGDISINADKLTGSGSLKANGHSEVEITNNSHRYLKVNNIDVPTNEGGNIRFNNISVAGNSDVTAINSDGTASGFSSIENDPNAGDSTVSITSNYNPNLSSSVYPGADIILEGDINNRNGLVSILAPYSNIDSRGDITAGEIRIVAGDSFVQSYVDTIFNVAESPSESWSTLAGTYESSKPDSASYNGTTPGTTGSITADGKVIIHARYINVNGTIKSGLDIYDALVENQMVTSSAGEQMNIKNAKSHYQGELDSGHYNADPMYEIWNNGKLTGYYNARENVIDLNNVKFTPGYVELYGQIVNTNNNSGQAQIIALDGYPSYSLDNNNTIPVIVNNVNVGSRLEGTIKITDLGKKNSSGEYLTTVWKRSNNVVTEYTNETTDSSGSPSYLKSSSVSRSGSYSPLANSSYVWNTGTETVVRTTYNYETDTTFFGLIDVSKDTAKTVDEEYLSENPLLEGEYITVESSPTYQYHYDLIDNSEDTLVFSKEWKDDGWFTDTYHKEEVYERGTKQYHTHQVRADYAIGIGFSGQDTSNININSLGDIILGGEINNPDGEVNVNSGGKILSTNTDISIIADSVSLDAVSGIGQENYYINMKSGALNLADTDSGSININEKNDGLVFGVVKTGSGNVNITSKGSITSDNSESYIKGDSITLVSETGSLGTDSSYLRLDTKDLETTGLGAEAYGDIYLTEISGSLGLDRVESYTGDVYLNVPDGNIYDISTDKVRDIATEADIVQLWEDMKLRAEDGALEQAQAGVDALEEAREQEYKTYWSYRNRQENPASYSSDFKIEFTADEISVYQEQGYSAEDIAGIESELTDKYHDLHEEYGRYGNAYNESLAFEVSAQMEADMTEGAVWTEEQLRNSVARAVVTGSDDVHINIDGTNIKGKKIVINTGGSVGLDLGSETIRIDGSLDLTEDQKYILSLAEAGDIEISDDKSTLTVMKRQDIDINASENISINAHGNVFLGSEDNINLNRIETDNDSTIRLIATNGIYNRTGYGTATNIIGKRLIIESDGGCIGNNFLIPINMDLTEGGSFMAKSNKSIYLREQNGDANIEYVYTPGEFVLWSYGGIYDAADDDIIDVRAGKIDFTQGNIRNIGSADNRLEVATLTGQDGSYGYASMYSEGSIYLSNPESSPFYIGAIEAHNINILSQGGIFNGTASQKKLKAKYVTLSTAGDVGSSESPISIYDAESHNITADDMYISLKKSPPPPPTPGQVIGGLFERFFGPSISFLAVNANITVPEGDMILGGTIDIENSLYIDLDDGSLLSAAGNSAVSTPSLQASYINIEVSGSVGANSMDELLFSTNQGDVIDITAGDDIFVKNLSGNDFVMNNAASGSGDLNVDLAGGGDFIVDDFRVGGKINMVLNPNEDFEVDDVVVGKEAGLVTSGKRKSETDEDILPVNPMFFERGNSRAETSPALVRVGEVSQNINIDAPEED